MKNLRDKDMLQRFDAARTLVSSCVIEVKLLTFNENEANLRSRTFTYLSVWLSLTRHDHSS